MHNLTRFEVTRLISARALQLSLGAPPMVKMKGESMVEVAREELKEKLLPMVVLRKFPNGEIERVELQ